MRYVHRIIVSLAAVAMFAATALAGEVEMLHRRTSGGEAAAVQERQKMLQGEGHTWNAFAVVGGPEMASHFGEGE